MRLGNYLSSLNKPRLEEIRSYCNFTDEEETIFYLLSKRKSIKEISCKIGMSTRCVDKRISAMRKKIEIMGELNVKKESQY